MIHMNKHKYISLPIDVQQAEQEDQDILDDLYPLNDPSYHWYDEEYQLELLRLFYYDLDQ